MIASIEDVEAFMNQVDNNSLLNCTGSKDDFKRKCCYECMTAAQKACDTGCEEEWKKEERRRLDTLWYC
jgi:hypothetical protein